MIKLSFSKMVEILQIGLYELHNEKTLFSNVDEKKQCVFLIFTIKLFSTALSNLTGLLL